MPAIDYFTEKGAGVLAERVRRYWLKRGYLVETWVERVFDNRFHGASQVATFGVRSNLVNGAPLDSAKVEGVAA